MDQYRQIRLLIPPFVLFASLFWADFLSCSNLINKIAGADNGKILAIVAALGVSTIPLGFLIGTIPIALFHLIELVLKIFKKNWSYEVWISEKAFKKTWSQVTKDEFDFRKTFYASATFDHDILPEGINKWLMRRWNAFNTNINCFFAVVLSYVALSVFSIERTQTWWITTIIFGSILLLNAIMAWLQTMKMIEFQANRNFKK